MKTKITTAGITATLRLLIFIGLTGNLNAQNAARIAFQASMVVQTSKHRSTSFNQSSSMNPADSDVAQLTNGLNHQILELAKRQVEQGKPGSKDGLSGQGTNESLPAPGLVKQIVLQAIWNQKHLLLAVINGRTFQSGDTRKIKVGKNLILLTCKEIKPRSVIVVIGGRSKPEEITMEKPQ